MSKKINDLVDSLNLGELSTREEFVADQQQHDITLVDWIIHI